MLSMLKDNRGIRSLYQNDTSPSWQRETLEVLPEASHLRVGGSDDFDSNQSAAVSYVLAKALRRTTLANPVGGQQRCQRCWKIFHIGPLADRCSFICWRCEYAICPNCRVMESRGAGWKCSSCVKPMSLMRLFETTKSGRELVVRVMEFCDPRAERILKSFFRFASLYAISSSSATGRGAGAYSLLQHSATNRIKAHLEMVQKESPAPSSYSYSISRAQAALETPSRFGDNEEEMDDGSCPGTAVSGGRSRRHDGVESPFNAHSNVYRGGLLGALSPNMVNGASVKGIDEKATSSRGPSAVRDKGKNSLDRLCVSESTHRCSTQLDNKEKRFSGGEPRDSGVSLILSDFGTSQIGKTCGQDCSEEKALFAGDETASPLLQETMKEMPGRPSGGSDATRSDSPAPRFPVFSAFLEDQNHHHHHHPQPAAAAPVAPAASDLKFAREAEEASLDSLSISSDSSSSVMELGMRQTAPQKSTSPRAAATTQARGTTTTTTTTTNTNTNTNTTTNNNTNKIDNSSPKEEAKIAWATGPSAAVTVPPIGTAQQLSESVHHHHAATPAAQPLVRTDSVYQAFERLASSIAETQRQMQAKSHPIVITGAPSKKTSARPTPTTTPRSIYSQRTLKESTSSKAAPATSASGAFQRTASSVRFGRTASSNPHNRPNKSSTAAPRARTTTAVSSSTATRNLRPTPGPSNNVYSRLYGNGTRLGARSTLLSSSATTTPRTGAGKVVSRVVSPHAAAGLAAPTSNTHPVVHPLAHSAEPAAPVPDLLTRQPSSHTTFSRVPSLTSVPLNRTDTAVPSHLKRSNSNHGGFSRTASRIAIASHVDPAPAAGSLSARGRRSQSPIMEHHQPIVTPREGTSSAARRHTPTPVRTGTPLQRQTTQVQATAAYSRQPSETFTRIPTTKNFERLCSLNRHHGLGDAAASGPEGHGSPRGTSAIAALATAGSLSLFEEEEKRRLGKLHRTPSLLRSPDSMQAVRGSTPPQSTPRTLLLSTPRVSGKGTSPRPQINSLRNTPNTTSPASRSPAAGSPGAPHTPSQTPSPAPKLPPKSPALSPKSPALSPSSLAPRISPRQTTKVSGAPASPISPVASPSVKNKPKVAIQTTTLSPRVKYLGTRLANSPSTTPRSSAAVGLSSRSPAASLIPKKRTSGIRLK